MLELKNISAGYGNHTVLEGVTADFAKGALTSVVGVNGCGKSTLLKSALGILPLSGGEIVIDGENIQSLGRTGIARRVAYLSQGKNTPDMTVSQLVLHGRFPHLSYPRRYGSADRKIASEAMESLGIAHLAHKTLSSLSGGMRQTAYIAMAICQDTDYILLDEPVTYLDIAHQLELMKLLRRLADAGKGIVTVMHDLTLAFNFSDEIAVIDGGRITAKATPTEISELSVIEDIFGVRMEKAEDGRFCYRY